MMTTSRAPPQADLEQGPGIDCCRMWSDRSRFAFLSEPSGGPPRVRPARPTRPKAWKRISSTNDVSARKHAYARAAAGARQGKPWVWLHYNTQRMILRPRLQNLNTFYSSRTKPVQMWVSS